MKQGSILDVKMKTKISLFLKEREDRFKPEEANKLGLKRLNKIDFSGEIHLTEKQTNTGMILIKPGDLVISGINVEKGALAVYQGDEEIMATIHYSSYEFDKKKINIDYFKWFLRSDSFRKIVQSQVRGGIKTELKPKRFLPLEIDLPDLTIQKQILGKINSIKTEINQLEKNSSHDKKLLSKLRQAILSEAVQGKLVPQNQKDEPASELLKKIKAEKEKLIKERKIKKQKPLPPISEDEIPYELPKGWVWTRLGEVCTLITDGSHNPPKGRKEGVPMISATNVLNDKIVFNEKLRYISKEEYETERKRNPIEVGDILLTIVGTIGRTCVVDIKDKFCLQRSVALIKSKINPNYLSYYLRSPWVLEGFIERGKGTAQKGIYLGKLSETFLPFPPLSEQKRIVEKVDALMKMCGELEEKIKENKKSSEVLMNVVLRDIFNSSV